MGEFIPQELQPPVAVALAKLVKSMPGLRALPGSLYYEPKWDGYRTIAFVSPGGVRLYSRQGKEFTRVFPDLAAALEAQVPPGVVLDGEAVIWNGDRLDFDALQQRMVTARAVLPAVVKELPAAFAAFDVLAVAGHDVRGIPFTGRRALLEELATDWAAPLNLSPTTTDRDLARTWLQDLPATGIEGLVFKGSNQPYQGGARTWLKLKHKDLTDVVCAAVIGPITAPQAIIAGLPVDGQLRIVGRSTVLTTATARDLSPICARRSPGIPGPRTSAKQY